MANNISASKEKSEKVMDVFYIEPEKKLMHIDYFTKKDQQEIVESFFIKGGLIPPPEVDKNKTMSELNEQDYIKFFEELGYEVTGFSIYDADQHRSYTVPWIDPRDIAKEKENTA